MIIYQAFRYELDPTNVQRGRLASHAGASRYAWNWALERVKEALEARAAGEIANSVPNAFELHRAWNIWKKQPGNCAWWAENSKCAYQEAFRDLDRALSAFWRARGLGRQVGFPKFKKKGRADHFRVPQPIRVHPHAVVLPKIGAIRTKEATGKLRGRILSASCRREADRWFVSSACEWIDLTLSSSTDPPLASTEGFGALGSYLTAASSTTRERLKEVCGGCAASTRQSRGSGRPQETERRHAWRSLAIIAECAISAETLSIRSPPSWPRRSRSSYWRT